MKPSLLSLAMGGLLPLADEVALDHASMNITMHLHSPFKLMLCCVTEGKAESEMGFSSGVQTCAMTFQSVTSLFTHPFTCFRWRSFCILIDSFLKSKLSFDHQQRQHPPTTILQAVSNIHTSTYLIDDDSRRFRRLYAL